MSLVDLARQNYPPQHRCPCGIVVRHVNGTWVDGAGVVHCGGGAAHVTVRVARSELLDPMRAILRGLDVVPGVAPPRRAPSSSPPPDFED